MGTWRFVAACRSASVIVATPFCRTARSSESSFETPMRKWFSCHENSPETFRLNNPCFRMVYAAMTSERTVMSALRSETMSMASDSLLVGMTRRLGYSFLNHSSIEVLWGIATDSFCNSDKSPMNGCPSRVMTTFGSKNTGLVNDSHSSRAAVWLRKASHRHFHAFDAATLSSQSAVLRISSFSPTRSKTVRTKSAPIPTYFPSESIFSNGSQSGSTHIFTVSTFLTYSFSASVRSAFTQLAETDGQNETNAVKRKTKGRRSPVIGRSGGQILSIVTRTD